MTSLTPQHKEELIKSINGAMERVGEPWRAVNATAFLENINFEGNMPPTQRACDFVCGTKFSNRIIVHKKPKKQKITPKQIKTVLYFLSYAFTGIALLLYILFDFDIVSKLWIMG